MNLPLLLKQIQHEQQRQLVWLAGSQSWTTKTLACQLSSLAETPLTIIRFSNNAAIAPLNNNESVTSETAGQSALQTFAQLHDVRTKQYKRYLGQETDIIIYDAFSGFNPDAFGALCGTLKIGGVIILVSPESDKWGHFADPELNRVCVPPYQPDTIKHGFLARLSDILLDNCSLAAPAVTTCFESHQANRDMVQATAGLKPDDRLSNDTASAPIIAEDKLSGQSQFANQDQQQLVAQLADLMSEPLRLEEASFNSPSLMPEKGAAVITADRGRGKTTSLALALAQVLLAALPEDLERQEPYIVLITCPLSDSVSVFFVHLQRLLATHFEALTQSENQISGKWSTGLSWQVQFVAPDQLSLQLPAADVVLIDEAAAIPVTLLTPVFRHYPYCILATTVHGYEGTGRCFEYKLKPELNCRFQNIHYLSLVQPVRWTSTDKLEPLVNRMLALDVKTDELVRGRIDTAKISYRRVSKHTLWQNAQLAESIFGLLVYAHYRTSPNDFRMLLDAPNIDVWVGEFDDKIVAAAMVASEGEIEIELAEQIWQGRRRPRGNLFPQSLLNHGGFKEAGNAKYGRIVRIAVDPELQGCGVGSDFVSIIKNALKHDNYDYICTSFGLTGSLLHFWQNTGFTAARLGTSPEPTTGELSLLMWQPLNSPAVALFKHVVGRFSQSLEIERQIIESRHLPHIVNVIDELVTNTSNRAAEHGIESPVAEAALSVQDKIDLDALVNHFRLPEHGVLAIHQLLMVTPQAPQDLLTDWLSGQFNVIDLKEKYHISSDKQWNNAIKQALCIRMQFCSGEI